MKIFKLAIRNVMKSFREYSVYLLTLTFGVCIFYIFNSFKSQQVLLGNTEKLLNTLKELNALMGGISVFISIILGTLIIYANRFLIRRRKKEFGIYMTLGMEKREISYILTIETLTVGLLSLVIGLVLGSILSQGAALITAQMLHLKIEKFRLYFSGEAAIKTMIYFGILFLIVLVFNVVAVRKQKLIDLIYASHQHERFTPPKTGVSILLFAGSVLCIGVAYVRMLSGSGAFQTRNLMLCIILGIVGTFLFFFSLSGFLLSAIKKNKRLYLKKLNMFVFRQVSSKIHTEYISMSIICILLFLCVSGLSFGTAVSKLITETSREQSPFALSCRVSPEFLDEEGNTKKYPGNDIAEELKQIGDSIDQTKEQSITVSRYKAPDLKLTVGDQEGSLNAYFIKLSDYNKILSLQGIEGIELDDYEYALNCNLTSKPILKALKAYTNNLKFSVKGAELKSKDTLVFSHVLETVANIDGKAAIVVPDQWVAGEIPEENFIHINYPDGMKEREQHYIKVLKKLRSSYDKKIEVTIETKTAVQDKGESNAATISFLSVYIGITFLITAAAILAIGQLSATSDNILRYSMLHKIGADMGMIQHALLAQILIAFGAPMLLALVHSVVGMTAASSLFAVSVPGNLLGNALFGAVILVIVYGGYFFLTYTGSKKMLMREFSSARTERI